ncbi:MAG: hypothetical protein MJZ34_04845 [Paludibacteraceae bacterium]|nr:hypothetical protein [Paludibacteraceae bacterium]
MESNEVDIILGDVLEYAKGISFDSFYNITKVSSGLKSFYMYFAIKELPCDTHTMSYEPLVRGISQIQVDYNAVGALVDLKDFYYNNKWFIDDEHNVWRMVACKFDFIERGGINHIKMKNFIYGHKGNDNHLMIEQDIRIVQTNDDRLYIGDTIEPPKLSGIDYN